LPSLFDVEAGGPAGDRTATAGAVRDFRRHPADAVCAVAAPRRTGDVDDLCDGECGSASALRSGDVMNLVGYGDNRHL
jgi:hypothetical protein